MHHASKDAVTTPNAKSELSVFHKYDKSTTQSDIGLVADHRLGADLALKDTRRFGLGSPAPGP